MKTWGKKFKIMLFSFHAKPTMVHVQAPIKWMITLSGCIFNACRHIAVTIVIALKYLRKVIDSFYVQRWQSQVFHLRLSYSNISKKYFFISKVIQNSKKVVIKSMLNDKQCIKVISFMVAVITAMATTGLSLISSFN